MENKLEEGDVVLCTVDRIIGTTVFVKIEGNGEGSIILSEIAPGRIRNLRDYVVPKKTLVCKILRTDSKGNIELTLRRVTVKEKKETMEYYKKEKRYSSLLKSILREKADDIIKNENVHEFIEKIKENPKELEKIAGKENSDKIINILKAEKQKNSTIKKEFLLRSSEPDGLSIIKKILKDSGKAKIKYLAAGKYSIKIESDDLKKADNELQEIIENIKNSAKKNKAEFSILKK